MTDPDLGVPEASLDQAMVVLAPLATGDARWLPKEAIALALNRSPQSGSLKTQLAAARRFGLVEAKRPDGYALTPLGRTLALDHDDEEARDLALSSVDLFRRVATLVPGLPLDAARGELASAFQTLGLDPFRARDAASVYVRSRRAMSASGASVPDEPAMEPTDRGAAVRTEVSHAVSRTRPDRPASYVGADGPSGSFEGQPVIAAMLTVASDDAAAWTTPEREAWIAMFASAVRYLHRGDRHDGSAH